MISRETIFQALFDLAAAVTWGSPPAGFAYAARRVKHWDDLPAQPALCQAEQGEDVVEVTGRPSITTLSASWLIYHDVGKDPAATPASQSNVILDAIQAVFPTGDPGQVQTLGAWSTTVSSRAGCSRTPATWTARP